MDVMDGVESLLNFTDEPVRHVVSCVNVYLKRSPLANSSMPFLASAIDCPLALA